MRAIDLVLSEEEQADPIREIGFKFLRVQIRRAARAVLNADTSATVQEALAFFQGSAMDTLFQVLELEVDPQSFREAFQVWVTHRHLMHNGHTWSSGSVIMPGCSSSVVSKAS